MPLVVANMLIVIGSGDAAKYRNSFAKSSVKKKSDVTDQRLSMIIKSVKIQLGNF